MSHALPGLVAEAGLNQLVIAPDRAVEEDQRRAGEPGLEIVGYAGAGGEKIEIPGRRLVGDPKPERVARAIVAAGVSLAFQIPGAFAGNGERQDLNAGRRTVGQCRLEWLVWRDRLAPHVPFVQHVEDAVGLQ